MDALAFRQVMGTFPTGVTVVAARDGGGVPIGLTVNAFTSVSLEPPLVLVCIDRGAASHDLLLSAGVFSVNVLSAQQGHLATRFSSDPSHLRFEDIGWREGPGGLPLLEGTAAWLACSLHSVQPGGDHSILVGRVTSGSTEGRDSLLFYRGSFGAAGT